MIGTPKYLNTKADYEYAHARALEGRIAHDAMRRHWEGLIHGAYCYRFDRLLRADEPADGPAPDFLVTEVEQDGAVVRRQQKRVRDAAARIDVLGYTEAEVQAKIGELGG